MGTKSHSEATSLSLPGANWAAIASIASPVLGVAALVLEPALTRAIGLSTAPNSGRFAFLRPGRSSDVSWFQRILTLNGWTSNVKIFSEQWQSRLSSLLAIFFQAWRSFGFLKYPIAIIALVLVVYGLYLIWDLLKPGTSSALVPWRKPASSKQASETRYSADTAFSSPEQASTSIIQDVRGAGLKLVQGDLKTLLEVAFSKGKPVDDKKMAMEKVVAIVGSLPPNSKSRKVLTNFLTEGLWKSLQHPPPSYQGDKFEYRMPDGSYNNVLFPDLGKAGTPYARTVRRMGKLDGIRPDPGLLFDTLMARAPGHFEENPAGLSSVLFYHASIIIHDIFRTNRLDPNISDTSSYLDLAPLYGSSLEDQWAIRTMKCGLLKPDTFHEKRLLGQPPGVNLILVMYSRFHNYVADMLLKINEGGRFTLPPTRNETEAQKAAAKQDNDLFQTARLIVCGLYINISLHDYLRGLTNTHATSSSWTIDPRVEIKKPSGDEVDRGCGNQVSAEFNLLYRFHSIISQRDEKWLNSFLASLFPGTKKKMEDLTPQELLQGLLRWEQNIPKDPSKRVFDGLKRGPDGKFDDEDLVRIMTEAMEAPAGVFGPRMVPKALRVVETLGILQARKWRMATLNEFRAFFGLKRFETMEDINPDPEIANILRHLYDSPDMVELYPGLFIEETKPVMTPGNGGCLGYTAGRAVFSDAITLVRSDRFYTIDYTPATLTNWGMQEVQQDYQVMGGSMFYKLFQRAVPGWYPYNSLHIMQPMYTWKKNKEIAENLGTIKSFTTAGPKRPPRPVIVTKHAVICKVLKNQTSFRVPWLHALNDILPGKLDFSSFMLSGDAASNTAQRKMLEGILFGPTDFIALLLDTVRKSASAALTKHKFDLPGVAFQVNIIKDVAIPVNATIIADLFALDLNSPENPTGTLSTAEMYKHLTNVRTWGFNNNDPAMAFRRRLWARESVQVLGKSTGPIVKRLAAGRPGLLTRVINFFWPPPEKSVKEGSLRWYGQHVIQELLARGTTVDEAVNIALSTAYAGIAAPVGVFADVLQFFLQPENADHWGKIQSIVANPGPTSYKVLRQYVLEAQRMTSRQRNLRICAEDTSIDGQEFKRGDAVICLLGPAGHDSSCIPNPHQFQPGRPAEAYIHFGHGPHECLGKEITLTYCVGLLEVVARLKNLRPAPGAMGELKSINVGTERCYLDDTWSWLTFDPTTWKLHFDGTGTGVHHQANLSQVAAGHDFNSIYAALARQNQEGPTSVDIAGSLQQSPTAESLAGTTTTTTPTDEKKPMGSCPHVQGGLPSNASHGGHQHGAAQHHLSADHSSAAPREPQVPHKTGDNGKSSGKADQLNDAPQANGSALPQAQSISSQGEKSALLGGGGAASSRVEGPSSPHGDAALSQDQKSASTGAGPTSSQAKIPPTYAQAASSQGEESGLTDGDSTSSNATANADAATSQNTNFASTQDNGIDAASHGNESASKQEQDAVGADAAAATAATESIATETADSDKIDSTGPVASALNAIKDDVLTAPLGSAYQNGSAYRQTTTSSTSGGTSMSTTSSSTFIKSDGYHDESKCTICDKEW